VSGYEGFLHRANQVERRAREMTSRAHREQLLEIAAEWRRMGERSRAEARSWKPVAKPDSQGLRR